SPRKPLRRLRRPPWVSGACGTRRSYPCGLPLRLRCRANSTRPPRSSTKPSGRRAGTRLERLAQEARAGDAVAPRLVHGLGEADARADGDLYLAGPPVQLERRGVERQAVVRPRNAERLAHPAGPAAEQALVRKPTSPAHLCQPLQRLDGADQHRTGASFGFAYEVHAPMDSV